MLRLNGTWETSVSGVIPDSNTTNVKVKRRNYTATTTGKQNSNTTNVKVKRSLTAAVHVQHLDSNNVFKGFMSILYFKKLDITSFFSIFTRRKPASPCS